MNDASGIIFKGKYELDILNTEDIDKLLFKEKQRTERAKIRE